MPIDQQIKFRHLQCFLEVARQKSVVKAAEILCVTQPAVSKTIRELEEVLGVALFERRGRGTVLSAYGEVMLRYASASVTALKEGVNSITQARSNGYARISIGALPTVSARIMPRAVRAFKIQHPDAVPRILTGDNAVLLSKLRVGDLDLVVGRLADPELMRGLSFEHLYSEHVSFVVRPGHPLLASDPFDIAGISRHPVLMPSEGSIIRPIVERFLISRGIAFPTDQIETVSPSFGRSYTRLSDCIWIISNGVIADDIAHGYLVLLPIDTSGAEGPVGLTTRADAPLSPAALVMMQAIRKAAADLEVPR